jgi:hypothetical protein
MANQTYNLVCDALSRIVSRKAAENIVSDALRSAKITPQDVRPEQMQTLLKSVVFARLQQIIPVAQAKGEIRQILNALETQFSSRAFSPEVEEGWNALREEFKRISNPTTPRAQRLAKNIADMPKQSDPVRVLNDLWAELDLLQLEENGGSPAAASEPRFQGDLLLESGEYAALNFELELPDSEPSPVFGRPGAGLMPRIPVDEVLRSTQDEVLRSTRDEVLRSSQDELPPLPQDLNLTVIEDVIPSGFDAVNVPPLALNLDGLIEIPQPELAQPKAATPKRIAKPNIVLALRLRKG